MWLGLKAYLSLSQESLIIPAIVHAAGQMEHRTDAWLVMSCLVFITIVAHRAVATIPGLNPRRIVQSSPSIARLAALYPGSQGADAVT